MSLPSIHDQWHIADGWLGGDHEGDGDWYIVRPDGEYAGPFTEDKAQSPAEGKEETV